MFFTSGAEDLKLEGIKKGSSRELPFFVHVILSGAQRREGSKPSITSD